MNAAATEAHPKLDYDAMKRNATDAVSLLKGLANESRLMIMCVLAEGEFSVGQLNERIKLSQSALSQHLAVLREHFPNRGNDPRIQEVLYYSFLAAYSGKYANSVNISSPFPTFPLPNWRVTFNGLT